MIVSCHVQDPSALRERPPRQSRRDRDRDSMASSSSGAMITSDQDGVTVKHTALSFWWMGSSIDSVQWSNHVDRGTRLVFYYCHGTREASWVDPRSGFDVDSLLGSDAALQLMEQQQQQQAHAGLQSTAAGVDDGGGGGGGGGRGRSRTQPQQQLARQLPIVAPLTPASSLDGSVSTRASGSSSPSRQRRALKAARKPNAPLPQLPPAVVNSVEVTEVNDADRVDEADAASLLTTVDGPGVLGGAPLHVLGRDEDDEGSITTYDMTVADDETTVAGDTFIGSEADLNVPSGGFDEYGSVAGDTATFADNETFDDYGDGEGVLDTDDQGAAKPRLGEDARLALGTDIAARHKVSDGYVRLIVRVLPCLFAC